MPDASGTAPWIWTRPARRLLAGLALLGASGLAALAPSDLGAPTPLPELVVDPNTAPAGVLHALPRLGPALVGRIVAAREVAPFRTLDDLDRRVKGIGPATILGLKPHLVIPPARP